MTEHPIIFSTPMVRAILDGRKTQTRRVVRDQTSLRKTGDGLEFWTGFMGWQPAEAILADQSLSTSKATRCPLGQPGDVLWVRETWAAVGDSNRVAHFKADSPDSHHAAFAWRSPYHLRRVDARLFLRVTAVRVERLHDISDLDAIREGCNQEVFGEAPHQSKSAVIPFERLWDSLNAKRAPWSSNPWVWVIEFEREDRAQAQ